VIGELGTRLRTPRFEPHVTLLAGLQTPLPDLTAACARFAPEVGPIHIRLGRPGHRDEYFRCLFLEAEDAGGLLEAHSAARAALAPEADPSFFPHISLLYAALERSVAESLVREIAGAGLGLDFEVRALDLVSTGGPPEAWRRLERFPLP
jgi:2'-5' RNA ligase